MTREEQIAKLTEVAREALEKMYPDAPDNVLENVLGEFSLVIAESGATEEQVEGLVAYLEKTEPIPTTVSQEREEVDDLYFDFRPPH